MLKSCQPCDSRTAKQWPPSVANCQPAYRRTAKQQMRARTRPNGFEGMETTSKQSIRCTCQWRSAVYWSVARWWNSRQLLKWVRRLNRG